MLIIYRILFSGLKKVETVKITPCQIPTSQNFPSSPLKNTGDGSIYIPP